MTPKDKFVLLSAIVCGPMGGIIALLIIKNNSVIDARTVERHSNITRDQAEIMLTRMSEKCGLSRDGHVYAFIPAIFSEYVKNVETILYQRSPELPQLSLMTKQE